MKIITNRMEIKFLSRSANEGFARVAVASFIAQMDPTLEELNDIKTSVSEAVTNSVVHAYPDTVGIIKITTKIFNDNSIEIEIVDKGHGIEDIQKAREPMFTTGGLERSGMGITIMENFMDSCKIKSKIGQGTTVLLSKKLSFRAGFSK